MARCVVERLWLSRDDVVYMRIVWLCVFFCILCHMKGADSAIIPRLERRDDELTARSLATLSVYAEDGLRTLCIAKRELELHTLDHWFQMYLDASLAIEHRASRLERYVSSVAIKRTTGFFSYLRCRRSSLCLHTALRMISNST